MGVDMSQAVNKHVDFVTFVLYDNNQLVQVMSLHGNKIRENIYEPCDNTTIKSMRIASINIYERIVYIQCLINSIQIILIPMRFDMEMTDDDFVDDEIDRFYIFTLPPCPTSNSIYDMKPLVVNANNVFLYGPRGLYKYNITDYQNNHMIVSSPVVMLASLPSPSDIIASDTHLIKSRLLLCFTDDPNPTIYIIDVLLGVLHSLVLFDNIVAAIPFNTQAYRYSQNYANYMKQNQVDHFVNDQYEYIVVDRSSEECSEPPLHAANKRKGEENDGEEIEEKRFIGSVLTLHRENESMVKLQFNSLVLTSTSNVAELVPLHEVLVDLKDTFNLVNSWSINATTILLLFDRARMIKVNIVDNAIDWHQLPTSEADSALVAKCSHPFITKTNEIASTNMF